MLITDTSDLWWKNAVIYCVDVKTFFDADHDGTGDLSGLAERVDYLAELGVTCLWLMPFYPTPGKDDGYDVVDFYGVDPRVGSLGDLVEVIRTVKNRGMRIIVDLVVNHTSDEHPWFKESRSSIDSSYRDYYIWRADVPPDTSGQVIFHGEQDAIWTRDDQTDQWYLHRFYRHQPDLNMANPKVRDEIAKIMGYWLQLGFDGFRIDAVPQFLSVGLHDDIESEGFTDPHGYLKSLRSFVSRRSGDSVLLGEVNLPHNEQLSLFGNGDGDELTMMFDFEAMQNLYLSLARTDTRPLARSLQKRPSIPADSQWATFVRNHDELTLDQLSQREQQEVFQAFGPDEKMQVYGRGIKRRLASMLKGDAQRIRMVYSLLFSLPGTPTLFYGEEIGMGEELEAHGRMAVRTPMQWSDGLNAGFSTADPSRLIAPVVAGEFGPAHVNVGASKRDADSLLNFITMLCRRYRECVELGWGEFELLKQPLHEVLAHRCTWEGSSILALHNLGDQPVSVSLTLEGEREGTMLLDLLQSGESKLGADGALETRLDAYGYRWMRVQRDEQSLVKALPTSVDAYDT